MRNLTPYGIFISSFIVGLFLAIQIQTGININPDYLIINVTDKIVQQMSTPQTTSMWEEMKLLITIIGIVSLVVDIFLILSFGLIGIISAFFGFLAGLLIILNTQIGAIFLIVGAVISTITIRS